MRSVAKTNKLRDKLPSKPKNISKVNGSHREQQFNHDMDELLRFNSLGNRARQSFNNDMPGGGYDGF